MSALGHERTQWRLHHRPGRRRYSAPRSWRNPGSAVPLSFRRDSTIDMIEDAIREITQALQKASPDRVYLCTSVGSGSPIKPVTPSDVRFGSRAVITHVR